MPDTLAPVAAQTVSVRPRGSLPVAQSCARKDLCAVAYPALHGVQRTQDFHFFDATLLLVLAGELHIHAGESRHRVNSTAGFCRADPGLTADLSKFPAAGGQFRSIYLTLSASVVSRFYQRYPEMSATARQPPQIDMLPADEELLAAFHALLTALESHRLSDARLEIRVFDLLLALFERGSGFSVQQNGISNRLQAILRDAPEARWTARTAGQALAMSEATLRRRLAQEGIRFDRVLLDIRMHHALMLLQTTPWNLLQIADACGYRSQARFSERFKARFGVSPAQIR